MATQRKYAALSAYLMEKRAALQPKYPALSSYLMEKRASAIMEMSPEEMEKNAGWIERGLRLAGNYGKHLAGQWGIGNYGVGAGVKTIGRFLGANKAFDPKTGKYMFQGVRNDGNAWHTIADKVADFGETLNRQGEKLKAPFAQNIANMEARHGKWAARGLKYGLAGSALGYSVAAPMAGENSLINLPNKAFTNAFMYGHPLGWAMTAGGAALNYGAGKLKDVSLNAAEQASRTTADQMAAGLAEQGGRMGHLYGVLDPTGYSDKARRLANDTITEQFKTLRQE